MSYEKIRLDFIAKGDFSKLVGAFKELQKMQNSMKPNTKLTKEMSNLTLLMERLKGVVDDGIFDEKDLKKVEQASQDVEKSVSKLYRTISENKGAELFSSDDIKRSEEVISALRTAEKEFNKLLTAQSSGLRGRMGNLNKILTTDLGFKGIDANTIADQFLGDPTAVRAELNRRAGGLKRSLQAQIDSIQSEMKRPGKRITLEDFFEDGAAQQRIISNAGEAEKKLLNTVKALELIQNETYKIDEAFKQLDLSAFDIDLGKIKSAEDLRVVISQLIDEYAHFAAVSGEAFSKETADKMKDLMNGAVGLKEESGEARGSIEKLNTSLENIKHSITTFFMLENSIRLFKNAVKEAFQVVKELDASMTEIAVVSDYSLEDVWGKRLDFSARASELGASTLDLVDATKLFVQQGMTLNEAQEVGIETIKMARIANLDGAEATDLMTSAIRGFNMEMNDAVRVNDVYSELAAKTASDTREIAIAMSKTASIANNAGASFENTAAFLAQIIEVTREAPETAGTALKTVIARFNELKKPLEEIGEVDGEYVDANRIEEALKSAGIALLDARGEFRAFDEVILELAQKWDTLDLMTQRYIATQAAGSRQQSRFIALLSDSERLLELTGLAADSAGSGNKQFEKTLDSLESKLNKLKNELHIFYTGLANSKVIKLAIDLMTVLLATFNKLTQSLTNSNSLIAGLMGSLINLGALGSVFIAGGKLADKLIGGFITSVQKNLKSAAVSGKLGSSVSKVFKDLIARKEAAKSGKDIGQQLMFGLDGAITDGSKGIGASLKDLFKNLSSVNKVGATFLGLGVATKALSSGLQRVGVISGQTADGLNRAADAAISVSSGMMLGYKIAGPWGLAIGAAAGAILEIVKASDRAKNAEKIRAEELQNNAEKSEEELKKVTAEIDRIVSYSDSFANFNSNINDLEVGSKEWRQELERINKEAKELINLFPELEFKVDSKTGLIEIDQGQLDALQRQKEEAENLLAQSIKVERAQADAKLNPVYLGAQEVEVTKEVQRGSGATARTEQITEKIIQDIEKVRIDPMQIFDPMKFAKVGDELTHVLINSIGSGSTFADKMTNTLEEIDKAFYSANFSGQDFKDAIESMGLDIDLKGTAEDVSRRVLNEFGIAFSDTEDAQDIIARAAAVLKGYYVDTMGDAVLDAAQSEDLREAIKGALSKSKITPTEDELMKIFKTDDAEEAWARWKDLLETVQKTLEETEEFMKLHNIFNKFKEAFGDLDPVMQALAGNIIMSAERTMSGAGEEVINLLGDAIEGQSEENVQKILNTFSRIGEISDQAGLDELADDLKKVGVEVPEKELQELINKFIELKPAIEDVTDAIKAETDAAYNVAKKAKEGKREGYTDDEIAYMQEKGLIGADDYYYTPDGNVLLTDPKDIYGQVNRQFAQDSREQRFDNQAELDRLGSAQATIDAYRRRVQDGFDQDKNIRGTAKVLVDKGLGADLGYTKQEIDQMDPAQLEELAGKIEDLALNVIDKGIENAQANQAALDKNRLALADLMTPDELTNSIPGLDAVERLDAYRIAASKLTVDTEEAKEVRQQLAEAIKNESEEEAAAAYHKLRTLELQKTMSENADKAIPKLEKLVDEYDKLSKMDSSSIEEMAENASDLAEAFEEYTGIEVSEEFFKDAENLELLKQALDGSPTAFQTLVDSAWIAQGGMYQLAEQVGLSTEDIIKYTNMLDGRKFDMEGNMDVSDIYEGLIYTLGSVEKAQRALEILAGTKVHFDYKQTTQSFTVPEFVTRRMNADPGKRNMTDEDRAFELTGSTRAVYSPKTKKITIPSSLTARIEKGTPGGTFTRTTIPPPRTGGTTPRRASTGGGGGAKGAKGAKGKKPKSGSKKGSKKGDKKKSPSGKSKKEAKDDTEPWVQAYDWLYNLVGKTNDKIREKAKLERDYEKILRLEGRQLDHAIVKREEMLKNLRETAKLHKEMLSSREKEMATYIKENADLKKYAQYDKNLGYVTIDWDAIEAVSDTKGNNELGQRIDEFISGLERISGQINDANDALDGIEDQVYELAKRGEDDLASLEQQVISALEELFEEEIQALERINSTVDTSNSKLLNALSAGIAEFRRDRALDRQADDIGKLERRIALLSMDTSGSNQMEILALEKQLEDQREAHLDSLVDKNIEEMQKHADEAAEQRALQIELMNFQLQTARESGEIARAANIAITEAMGSNTDSIKGAITIAQEKIFSLKESLVGKTNGNLFGAVGKAPATLTELLERSSKLDGMGRVTQDAWRKDLDQSIENGFSYWANENRLDGDSDKSKQMRKAMAGRKISFTDRLGNKREGVVQSDGRVKVGNTYWSGITQGTDGSWFQNAAYQGTKARVVTPKPKTSTSAGAGGSGTGSATDGDYKKIAAAIWRLTSPYQGGWGNDPKRSNWLGNVVGPAGAKKVQEYINSYVSRKTPNLMAYNYADLQKNYTYSAMRAKMKKFKKGGLANFTGPAWLDGTKSEPELVLNQQDTRNFLQLNELLRSMKLGDRAATTTNLYFNVDAEFANDYDVSKFVKKVKEEITKEQKLGRVNIVNF